MKREDIMRIVEEFHREVRAIEGTWIQLSDGVRLSAKIWLPEDAESDPVPAISNTCRTATRMERRTGTR